MKFYVSVFCVVLLAVGARAVPPMFDPQQLEFFEKQVRPLLAEKCYKCHSVEAKKSKGSLYLDSRDAILKGGDSGPALVPGQPDKSLIIKAVRYADEDLAMPPAKEGGKLPAEQIAILEQWIKNGAVDPRIAKPGERLGDMEVAFEKAKHHWAFQPVAAPAIPKVKDAKWVRSPVDAFVKAKLEEKKLYPADEADRRTLIRRAYLDLTGLPPTLEQVAAFEKDKSTNAFAKVVDELLASPRYGERWGRYWLDIARYADTKGYVFQEERRYPFAYTYRDYVIRAFNEDRPFDQFLIEQIAADQFVQGEDKSALAAMGFLTVGRRFLNNQNDIIDDRMDATIRGTMALTIACARCHDHKFDPIPTKDYYALHGVFASSEEPEELPLLGKSPDSPQFQEYLKKKAEVQAKIDAKTSEAVKKHKEAAFGETGNYLLGVRDSKSRLKEESMDAFAKSKKLEPKFLTRWVELLNAKDAGSDPLFGPWLALAALPENEFTNRAAAELAKFVGKADSDVLAALAKKKPAAIKDVVAVYNELFKVTTSSAPAAAVAEFRKTERAPPNLSDDEVEKLIKRKISNDTESLRKQLAAVEWEHPGAPARAMAMTDKAKPHNSRIFIRGNAGNPGPEAVRRFLTVIGGTNAPGFTKGSGRLELAQAIASKDNPLTARVFVNRVWGWHFGTPLVRTPGDFGVRTEAPVHLDLLNHLAASFMAQGWSVKKLHREIMLSSTYQQASDGDSKAEKADPENQLVHKFNRRRLEFEAMRDTILAVSGKLDMKSGGLPVDIEKEPFTGRRTVYGFIDRQNLPGLFRTFDFASPDASTPQRSVTTVPQQALFLMNSPFLVEQARSLVRRDEITSISNDAERIVALYSTVFQRPPERTESKLLLRYIGANSAPVPREAIAPGWHYGTGWYNPLANLIKDYKALTNFSQGRYSPASKFPLPDERGHVMLTQAGGHPGDIEKVSSIRRWVAPADGAIQIKAELTHDNKSGDGIRAMLVTGRGGKIGEWVCHTNKFRTDFAKLDVKLGETVDFVVDCLTSPTSDSYTWAPIITLTPTEENPILRLEWDARKDFGKTYDQPDPLTGWEKLAQVLLLSNELMFIE